MKPPAFAYCRPASVAEALAMLSEQGEDARPLAGGQSLVPLLNFRLVRPSALVDLGGIERLRDVSISDSSLVVGAMVRTARLLEGDLATASPVLSAAAKMVGHPQIRSRGTVGGSLAHADPAAELPAAAVLLDAAIELEGPAGARSIRAESFFQGVFQTACAPHELVVHIVFPRHEPGTGWAFEEFSRRRGDFALAGVGVVLKTADGVISWIRIVVFGSGSRPVRPLRTESLLLDRPLDRASLADAGEQIAQEVEASDSLHGSADYRRRLTGVLLERALTQAVSRE